MKTGDAFAGSAIGVMPSTEDFRLAGGQKSRTGRPTGTGTNFLNSEATPLRQYGEKKSHRQGEETTRAAKAIIEQERAAREKKTERLRKLRLEKDARSA